MDVDDSCELRPFLVSVGELSLHDRETANADACLLGCEEKRDHLQNLRITLRSVIESRGVDESHSSSVENEFIRELNLGCA